MELQRHIDCLGSGIRSLGRGRLICEASALAAREWIGRLTDSKVGWIKHGAEIHLVPDISSSTGIGVAIHLGDPGLVSWID